MKKIFTSLIFLLSVTSVYAGLGVSPSRVEMSLSKNEACQGSYSVTNSYDVPIKVNVSARDWFVLPENKDINISSWIEIEPQELALKPGETGNVKYQVYVPTSAVGCLVGMVSFVPVLEQDQGFTLMMSASLFVTVKGTEKVEWDLLDTKIDMYEGKLQINTNVKNIGNVYLRPLGEVAIISGKKQVANMNFLEGRPVYPGSERSITATAGDQTIVLKKGKYKAFLKVDARGQTKKQEINFKVDKAGKISLVK